MVAAFERETGRILDYRIERNAAAKFLVDTTVDDGALHRRTAFFYDHEQVEVGLAPVITTHA